MLRSATLVLAALCSCAGPATKTAWPTTPLALSTAEVQGPPSVPRESPSTVENTDGLPVVTVAPERPGAGGGLDSHLPSIHPAPRRENEPIELLPGRLTFRWPLPAAGVNSLFGARKDPIDASRRFHFGVDLAADYGEVVESTAPGVVIYAGWNGGHGRTIVVDHEGGYRSVYSHLAQVLVYSGAWVEAGRAIGRVGNSGRSTGAHLHFEVLLNGKHLDPLDLMGASVEID